MSRLCVLFRSVLVFMRVSVYVLCVCVCALRVYAYEWMFVYAYVHSNFIIIFSPLFDIRIVEQLLDFVVLSVSF